MHIQKEHVYGFGTHIHTHTQNGTSHTHTPTALCTMVLLLLLHCNRFAGIIILYGGKGETCSPWQQGEWFSYLPLYTIYMRVCVCVCVCVRERVCVCASGESLNVMNLWYWTQRGTTYFLNIAAGERQPNKENTIQEKENSYIRQQTEAYGILPLTMHYQMVGLTTQPLSWIYSWHKWVDIPACFFQISVKASIKEAERKKKQHQRLEV